MWLCMAVVVLLLEGAFERIGSEEECFHFDKEYQCREGQATFPEEFKAYSFQTPPRKAKDWIRSYGDLNIIQGYVRTEYIKDNNAMLTFVIKLNKALLPAKYELIYYFGKEKTKSPQIVRNAAYFSEFTSGYQVKAILLSNGSQIATLEVEKLFFIFNVKPIDTLRQYEGGQRGVIVELFGWPYKDIEAECEFLGRAGYLGVKIWPPHESVLSFDSTVNGELNPWYYVYQPVSYKLASRLGSIDDLARMIKVCRRNRVRIYVDSVINHMAGKGSDIYPYHRMLRANQTCKKWSNKNSTAYSPFFTYSGVYENNRYTHKRPGLEFPAVPYDIMDFHCERDIKDFNDPFELNNGWFLGLTDLNTESAYVQQRIADYFTSLLSMGVSGFRIDAARQVSPQAQAAIYGRVKKNLGGKLSDDFLIYLQIFIGLKYEQKDLIMCKDNLYGFGDNFIKALQSNGFDNQSDIDKVKIWMSDYPMNFPICGELKISPGRTVIGTETVDDQTEGGHECRDFGDKGSVLLLDKDKEKHKQFVKHVLKAKDTASYKIKLLLSSFSVMTNGSASFPDGFSDCSKCANEECKKSCTKSMPNAKAHDPLSKGYDCIKDGKWKEGVYCRVHRDYDVIKSMRKWLGLSSIEEASLYE